MLLRQHTHNYLRGMIILNIKQKRILIFGAGVVGSIYALRFAQSGLDVTLLARGERLKSLKKDGLDITIMELRSTYLLILSKS